MVYSASIWMSASHHSFGRGLFGAKQQNESLRYTNITTINWWQFSVYTEPLCSSFQIGFHPFIFFGENIKSLLSSIPWSAKFRFHHLGFLRELMFICNFKNSKISRSSNSGSLWSVHLRIGSFAEGRFSFSSTSSTKS